MRIGIALAVVMGLSGAASAARAQCPVVKIIPGDPTLVASAGQLFQVTFTAVGGTEPYTFSSDPPGVAATGSLSFTIATPQAITLVVSVTDAAGCTGQKSYVLSVVAAATSPEPPPAPGPSTTDDHSSNPYDYAVAMDIPTESILSASFPMRHQFSATTASRWGVIQPQRGPSMVALSTGIASVEGMPGYAEPQPGTDFGAQTTNPFPTSITCRDNTFPGFIPDGAAYDLTELAFTLRVPAVASGLSFDFNFLTTEFPESVCTIFGDRFLALLESQAYRGNLAIDAVGQPMSASSAWVTVTDPSALAGTGMEHFGVAGRPEGAATGWRRVVAPVVPGEEVRLRFIVFDTGDGMNDSQALIDNFAWCSAPSIGNAAVDRSSLWPPNGDLVDVSVSYGIEGGCGPVTSTLTVTANEPLAAGDALVVDGHHVRLRAARVGSGAGRIYTITISAVDSAGHVSRSSVAVTVPHDQRR